MIWIRAYQAAGGGPVYLLHEDRGQWDEAAATYKRIWVELELKSGRRFCEDAHQWVTEGVNPGPEQANRPTGPLRNLLGIWTDKNCIFPDASADQTIASYFA